MADNMLIDGLIKFCDEKSKNIKLKAEPQVFIEIKQALEELKTLKEFVDDDMINLEVNIESSEGVIIPEPEIIDDSYDQTKDEDIEEIDYEENVDIEEIESELELDDFNDEH